MQAKTKDMKQTALNTFDGGINGSSTASTNTVTTSSISTTTTTSNCTRSSAAGTPASSQNSSRSNDDSCYHATTAPIITTSGGGVAGGVGGGAFRHHSRPPRGGNVGSICSTSYRATMTKNNSRYNNTSHHRRHGSTSTSTMTRTAGTATNITRRRKRIKLMMIIPMVSLLVLLSRNTVFFMQCCWPSSTSTNKTSTTNDLTHSSSTRNKSNDHSTRGEEGMDDNQILDESITSSSLSLVLQDHSTQQKLHYLKAATELEEGLPTFLVQYLKWHTEMRHKYPGKQIIEHVNAPKVLIRYTSGPSSHEGGGGLYDRLAVNFIGDFLWASANKRVLLYLWHHPRPLTDFLAPNHIDWTVPEDVIELKDRDSIMKQRSYAITPKVNDTVASSKIILYNSPRGLIDVNWEKYNITVSLPTAFDKLWNFAFKPSEYVEKILNKFWNAHPPGKYCASHIRLLHPSFYDYKKSNVIDWKEDQDLPWTDETMKVTIPPTIHALRCAMAVQDSNITNHSHPHRHVNTSSTTTGIYLFSDWITMLHQLQELVHKQKNNHSYHVSAVEKHNVTLTQWVTEKMKHIHLLDNILLEHSEVAHLKTPNQTLQAYASSFIDIYIAAGAKCLSYGLGRFGYLASLIGGHSCLNRHQHPTDYMMKRWNMWESVKGAPMCTVSHEYPMRMDPNEIFNGFWSHTIRSSVKSVVPQSKKQ